MRQIIVLMFAMAVIASCGNNPQKSGANDDSDTKVVVKDSTTYVSIGDVAPDFTVEMLDGRQITLSSLKGKVVMLNFWATWCGPCMQEFREIPEKIIKRFEGNKDFVLLPISREETKETVAAKMDTLSKSGIDFPVGINPDRSIYSLYAKQTIPRIFIIDKKGKIAHIFIGLDEENGGLDAVAEKIAELL